MSFRFVQTKPQMLGKSWKYSNNRRMMLRTYVASSGNTGKESPSIVGQGLSAPRDVDDSSGGFL